MQFLEDAFLRSKAEPKKRLTAAGEISILRRFAGEG
jgi:hypothetical protein